MDELDKIFAASKAQAAAGTGRIAFDPMALAYAIEQGIAARVAAERERWRARMLERMREYDHLAAAAATETGARLFRAKAGALAELIDGPNVRGKLHP